VEKLLNPSQLAEIEVGKFQETHKDFGPEGTLF
jgi:hypothetical protein